MDILRPIAIMFILLMFWMPTSLRAEISGGELELDTDAGLDDIYSLGGSGALRFDSGDLHLSYTKQLSPSDPSSQTYSEKHTENWSGGFGQQITEKLSMGLDYDQLSDDNERLYTNGAKLSLNYDVYHLSFRFGKSELDQDFSVTGLHLGKRIIYGAFVYQSTLTASVDLTLTQQDSLSPTASLSVFSPNISDFSNLISKSFATQLSNMSDTLQSFSQWSLGASYEHDYNKLWTAFLNVTLSHLIVGLNPSIETNPSVKRNWGDHWSTELGIDWVYIPGSPSYMATMKTKYTFDSKSKEEE